MKEQYLIGVQDNDYIRVSDGTFGTMCTRNKDDLLRLIQKQKVKKHKSKEIKLKLYKLVEVKE